MITCQKNFTILGDESDDLVAVVLHPSLWSVAKDELMQLLRKSEKRMQASPATCEVAEPLEDWNVFFSYWDFKYPQNLEVKCDACGALTEDWQKDEPRKFRLLAATLGGMVRFRCLACQAKISKKHFKDCVKYEIVKGC